MAKKNPTFSFLARMLIALGAAMIIVAAVVLMDSGEGFLKLFGVLGILLGAGIIIGSNMIRTHDQKMKFAWLTMIVSFAFILFGLFSEQIMALGAGFSLIGALIGITD
jgi:hypothetical protein